MWIKILLLIIVGLGGGVATAVGYFAILASIGIITRFADYTGTASKIRVYEMMLCLGGIIGNILIVFKPHFQIWNWLSVVFGLMIGIFVGSFLVSLAEAVKGIPVFLRRSRVQKGVSLIIILFALGKSLGSIFYFCCYLLGI